MYVYILEKLTFVAILIRNVGKNEDQSQFQCHNPCPNPMTCELN